MILSGIYLLINYLCENSPLPEEPYSCFISHFYVYPVIIYPLAGTPKNGKRKQATSELYC